MTRSTPRFSRGDLLGWLQIEEEPENGRLDEEGNELEVTQLAGSSLADDAYEELWFRSHVLGTSYPFDLEVEVNQWMIQLRSTSVSPQDRLTHEIYIFCLLVSVIRKDVLQYSKESEVDKPIPELFQALTVVAARAFLKEAYWFGTPRPDGKKNLVSGLTELIRQVGFGKLKDPLPPSRNNRENDGGVDVVAWRPFADGMSAIFMFGQAASGKHYKGKDVGSHLASDFKYFFSEFFAESYLTALFIPFMQHDMWGPLKSVRYEEAALDHAMRNESKYGLVFDRMRLCELGPEIYRRHAGVMNAELVAPHGVLRSAIAWNRMVQRTAV